jgi:membrane-associated protease RseP (regulator of RpoE activity)
VPWQALLWLATAATTFAAGVVGWQPLVLGVDADLAAQVPLHWGRGLAYMLAVLAVLGAHEAGHFVAAGIHRIPATLPFFLPVPVMLTGTLGAVIGMEGSRANRRQLFDIAIAGPLAGLVLAVPALVAGMVLGAPSSDPLFAMPPLARWLMALVRPDLLSGGGIAPNPLYMAGWVGLLVTGLNMIPISQLDGGHVVYALFGPRANWLARSLLCASIAGIVFLGRYNWIIMVVLVTVIGADHPPIREEGQPLDRFRTVLGLCSLVIPLVTFMPEPLHLE